MTLVTERENNQDMSVSNTDPFQVFTQEWNQFSQTPEVAQINDRKLEIEAQLSQIQQELRSQSQTHETALQQLRTVRADLRPAVSRSRQELDKAQGLRLGIYKLLSLAGIGPAAQVAKFDQTQAEISNTERQLVATHNETTQTSRTLTAKSQELNQNFQQQAENWIFSDENRARDRLLYYAAHELKNNESRRNNLFRRFALNSNSRSNVDFKSLIADYEEILAKLNTKPVTDDNLNNSQIVESSGNGVSERDSTDFNKEAPEEIEPEYVEEWRQLSTFRQWQTQNYSQPEAETTPEIVPLRPIARYIPPVADLPGRIQLMDEIQFARYFRREVSNNVRRGNGGRVLLTMLDFLREGQIDQLTSPTTKVSSGVNISLGRDEIIKLHTLEVMDVPEEWYRNAGIKPTTEDKKGLRIIYTIYSLSGNPIVIVDGIYSDHDKYLNRLNRMKKFA